MAADDDVAREIAAAADAFDAQLQADAAAMYRLVQDGLAKGQAAGAELRKALGQPVPPAPS